MFAGHFFLAFLIAALIAYWQGLEKKQTLVLGLFAGGLAVLPDLDIVYALKGLTTLLLPGSVLESFWSASKIIHRGISHSLVTGFIAATLFTLGYEKNSYIGNILSTVFLGVFAFMLDGWIGAGVLALYGAVGAVLATYAEKYISRKELYIVSLIGLLSHPFGDILTGTPPQFLYPFNIELIGSRIPLSTDPTINIILVLILEILIILTGILFMAYLKEKDLKSFITKIPLLGLFYGFTSLFIPDPTLSNAYTFVFSILGYGLTVSLVQSLYTGNFKDYFQVSIAALLTVLVSAVSYLVIYLSM